VSSLRPADAEGFAFAHQVGIDLGLDVVRVYDREGDGWLVHGYWHGAPVAISLRTGLVGGLGVAFWDERDVSGNGHWDEVLDTSFGELDATIALGVAALERYAAGRESNYVGTNLPSPLDGEASQHELRSD